MREEVIVRELSAEQRCALDNSRVRPVEQIRTVNKQAVAEGLLYIVGEDGLKEDQLAAVREVGEDEALALLHEIRVKYDDEAYGIELVNYGGRYKFVSKAEFVTVFVAEKVIIVQSCFVEHFAKIFRRIVHCLQRRISCRMRTEWIFFLWFFFRSVYQRTE